MNKNACCTCKVVLLIKPIAFLTFSLMLSWLILKSLKIIFFCFQTVLDDASGNDSVQNSRSDDRGASPLNLPQTVSSAANQEINTNAMTTSAMPPNLASTSAQSVLRTTVQLRQMVSSQLSGNTVAISQMSTTQYSTCVPVIQSLGDRVSPVVEDMTWVSFFYVFFFIVKKHDLKQQKRAICFARLLLNQLNSDVLRFTSRV